MNNNIENQNINNINNNNVKNQKSGRELFYGVVGLSTFILIIVGATFAYFTASTQSGSNSVGTSSAKLELKYISYNGAWQKHKLIPVKTGIAEYSVENQDVKGDGKNAICTDDNGDEICSMYVFQIQNDAQADQVVSIKLRSDINEFGNLNAMIYKLEKDTGYNDEETNDSDPGFITDEEDQDPNKYVVTDGANIPLYDFSPIYVNRKGVKKELLTYLEEGKEEKSYDRGIIRYDVKNFQEDHQYDEEADGRTVKLADEITINGTTKGGNISTFMIVLYIKDNDKNQNDTDSAKSFSGTVIVSSGDNGEGVSGRISAYTEPEEITQLQSGLKTEPKTDEKTD